ncbi:NUDIX domain-containing protein [Parahaliea maris]|uniref:NUDIX domain-containing protein n=1 Tax=Parahaliea maris TaxID=2716870 RepID=A0A5C9A6A9_9GAMM|nr:NUDIX domain-containing protein [Parahaliea maris]TXS95542.1 NUDIX domain-containing protein [Parahaliea maris]
MSKASVPLRLASTVVLLRDAGDGLETLLLRRNKALLFAGGFWVFPGGAIEEQDFAACEGDCEQAARVAAAREAMEEASLEPRLDDMRLLSNWITPVVEPKRFDTWIYAAPVASDERVVIDGSEIHDWCWIGLRDAVTQHEAGELGILPPTYLTLRQLQHFDSVDAFLSSPPVSDPLQVLPVFGQENGETLVMFAGDAGYEAGDATRPGARHRAILRDRRWQYIYQPTDTHFPRLDNV